MNIGPGESFGFTPRGYVHPSYEQIRAWVVASYRRDMGQDIDISDNSLIGKDISIQTLLIADRYALHQQQQTFFNKHEATGAILEQIGDMLNIPPLEAEHATVELELRGINTTVPAGRVVTNASNTIRFVTMQPATLVSADEPVVVLAQAVEQGDVGFVDAHTLVRIESPVAGWIVSSATPVPVTNPAPASPGRDDERDSDYRARILNVGVGGTGRATLPAIEAVMRGVVGVEDVFVDSNRNEGYDLVRGIAGKTVRVIISPDTVRASLIGEALYNVIGATDGTMGPESHTVVRAAGEDHVMRWSFAEEAELYFNVWLETDDDFPVGGEALVRNVVAGYVGSLGIGDVMKFSPLNALVFGAVPGVVSVEFDVREGFAPPFVVGTPPDEWPWAWTGPTYAPDGAHRRLVVADVDRIEIRPAPRPTT